MFVLFLIGAELVFRVVRDLVRGGPQAQRLEAVPDPELGWALNPGRKPVQRTNACGERVVREPPPSRYLVKVPVVHGPVRILFLGDSYTQAHEVSTGAAYYDVLERLSEGRYAVYAAGAAGYGTVQEYLLLRRLHADVRPHVLVWQLSDNDVGDNVFVGRNVVTVQLPRPYLDPASGKLFVADPSVWLFQTSHLAKFMLDRLLRLDQRYEIGLWRAGLSMLNQTPADPPRAWQQGLAVISLVLQRVRDEHPDLLVVGFSVDPKFDDDYRSRFAEQGLTYIAGVSQAVRSQGLADCTPWDEHWNRRGNELAGREMARALRRLETGPRVPPAAGQSNRDR